MPKLQLKKIGMLALAVLLVQLVLSQWIYPLIEKSTTTLFSIEPSTGIGGTQIGDKVLGYLTGYIPFDLTSWLTYIAMYIGAFVLIWAGLFLYDTSFVRNNLYTGKSLGGRIFAILLYGHFVLYLVLLIMKFNVPGIAINLLIGLGVNLILVSMLVSLLANKIKAFRI
jgi:hypothetical protein